MSSRFRPWPGADPREAVALRRWTLEALAAEVGEGPGPAPPAGEETWAFFLFVERCGAWLARAVRRHGEADLLPPRAADLLRRAADGEIRRSLAARAEIRSLDHIAAEGGWSPVLLKGGITVHEGEHLHVHDLDLLVDGSELEPFVARMEEEGYRGLEEDVEGRHHVAPRQRPGSVPIEVHDSVKHMGSPEALLERSLPLPGLRAMRRPAGPDELRHALFHLVLQHPDRLGRIRDLFAVGDVLSRLPEEEAAAVEGALADRADAELFRLLLRAARALRGGRPEEDPFRVQAARRYALRYGVGSREPMRLIMTRALWIVSDDRSVRDELGEMLAKDGAAPTENPWVRRARAVPLLGPLSLGIGRIWRSSLALALAGWARWKGRRILRQDDEARAGDRPT